jgi:hypothetical protein
LQHDEPGTRDGRNAFPRLVLVELRGRAHVHLRAMHEGVRGRWRVLGLPGGRDLHDGVVRIAARV